MEPRTQGNCPAEGSSPCTHWGLGPPDSRVTGAKVLRRTTPPHKLGILRGEHTPRGVRAPTSVSEPVRLTWLHRAPDTGSALTPKSGSKRLTTSASTERGAGGRGSVSKWCQSPPPLRLGLLPLSTGRSGHKSEAQGSSPDTASLWGCGGIEASQKAPL